MAVKTAISPTRAENYPEWYQQVIKKADMAENSSVHGCMIIKPWGFAIWENIQKIMDQKLKETGHENLYFPLFIPLSYLEREAQHVEGFAKECAVVTHHRLAVTKEGKLEPVSPLEEPLIIRPTSETIIGEAFARWIQSYRDLPLRINQWANIVRWEMRTRMFLRTSEFLWQEGHAAYATPEEANKDTLKMLEVYAKFAEEYMAMPVIQGRKTESEKFPGAEATYCIEAMMQDKKALQAGTTHFLGQNFSKVFDIKFLTEEGKQEHVWTASWGVSTRLIGSLIMAHSDDDGLVLPPRLTPLHVVILPVIHKLTDQEKLLNYCNELAKELNQITYHEKNIQVKVDTKDGRPGDKTWSWVKKGVPIRLEIGPKELESNSVYCGRRDKSYSEKSSIARAEFMQTITKQLDEIQSNLLENARKFLQEHSITINSEKEFYAYFKGNNGGFAYAYCHENEAIEAKLKQDLSVTMRCIPLATQNQRGTCIFSNKPDAQLILFAKAY